LCELRIAIIGIKYRKPSAGGITFIRKIGLKGQAERVQLIKFDDCTDYCVAINGEIEKISIFCPINLITPAFHSFLYGFIKLRKFYPIFLYVNTMQVIASI